jgi:hypothetical protein
MADPKAREASKNHDDASDPGSVAAAIRRDFQLLVDALTGQMELLDEACEVFVPLTKARRAAELGVEISDRLLKSIADRAV